MPSAGGNVALGRAVAVRAWVVPGVMLACWRRLAAALPTIKTRYTSDAHTTIIITRIKRKKLLL